MTTYTAPSPMDNPTVAINADKAVVAYMAGQAVRHGWQVQTLGEAEFIAYRANGTHLSVSLVNGQLYATHTTVNRLRTTHAVAGIIDGSIGY